jgi:hypothetical protein
VTTPLEDLMSVHEVQGRDGTWDYTAYMRGLYNGLELALSFLEGKREPRFRDEPERGYREDHAVPIDPLDPVNHPVPAKAA